MAWPLTSAKPLPEAVLFISSLTLMEEFDIKIQPLLWDPVTMVVLTTGHQVRCILWIQVAIFNKGIGFLCGLKCFTMIIFCDE